MYKTKKFACIVSVISVSLLKFSFLANAKSINQKYQENIRQVSQTGSSKIENDTMLENHYQYSAVYQITWQEFEDDVILLTDAIKHSGKHFKGMIVVTRGGLAPASIISQRLDIKHIQTFCAYRKEKNGQLELKVLYAPDEVMATGGEGWLILDELVDHGFTLSQIKKLFPKATFATVYVKQSGVKMVDFYGRLLNEDGAYFSFPWEVNEKDE